MTILGLYLLNQIRTGGDRRYLELMELLAERGNTVIVIINEFLDYTPIRVTKIELPVKYRRHRFPPASYLFKKNLQKNIGTLKDRIAQYSVPNGAPDFIHIHGDTHLKAALFLKHTLHLPLFYAFRCNDIDRACILRSRGGLSAGEYLFSRVYEPVNRSREKQVAHYAELVTFQNTADKDRFLLRTGSAESKTVIIPGNIGPPRCTPAWQNKNTSSAVKNIVYIGSLSASKGLWDLLKALGLLKEKSYDFLRCYVLGRPENSEQTMELIKKIHIEDMISLEGFKSPFPYLAEHDLMVYPTLYDAYPDTALEALHTGCPVIAAAVGGLPDLLHYPELLFASGNIQEIADRIERCITDTAFYQHIRRLCARRAEAHHFDWAERFETAMADYSQARLNGTVSYK
ncbi:MAG: glycosyltransferase family 4 protein [Treponema sp.]|jgi:glycosyltransferase involved in cell wall biosynthesis|nr:glycosyltransferase family 4 protein [Treponema sp.]